MRPGFGQFNTATPDYLRFCAQFGATDVLLNAPILPSDGGRWELSDLVRLRLNVEQYGPKLSAIENVPISFYDHIMLGGPKRDEQIENMVYTIRNIARAGIPIFGYHWMPSGVWRTTPEQIRYGALATAFDYEQAKLMPLTHGREYTEEEMWENLEHWIRIITPIAEEEGIRLGIHPCDPPVPVLSGVPEFINTGYVDMYRAMKTYHEVGFDGFFIDDYVPDTYQDTVWGHRGRAFANGYIQALIEAVTKQAGGA